MSKEAMREINKMLMKDLARKPTVASIEEHAKDMFGWAERQGTKEQKEFYKGCLRMLEVLRNAKLLRE